MYNSPEVAQLKTLPVLERAHSLVSEITALESIVREYHDRLFGSQPEASSPMPATPRSIGAIVEFEERYQQAMASSSRTQSMLSRINGAI